MTFVKKNISFVSCSLSKILFGLLVCSALVLAIRHFLHQPTATATTAEANDNSHARRSLKEDVEGEPPFVEVARAEPRIGFSTLDKLLAEQRKLRNHSPGFPIKQKSAEPLIKEENPPIVGGLSGGIHLRGSAGLSNIKASLKDPSFVKKIRDLEDKRQDLYVSILKKRGQIVKDADGSETIVSYAQVPVRFPNNLKRSISDWSDREKFWLNITHFPWPLDPSCQRYSVNFGHDLPVVGLASYPSSGNTWVRYLIEGITGYYTGSMYNDLSLRKTGFYGEGIPADSGMVLTVKTHGFTTEAGSHVPREEQHKYNHQEEVNNTAIILIRNPFDAILGHRHLDQGGHIGLARPEQFQGEGWDEFVRIKANSWVNFYSDWLDSTKPNQTLVIHYENIKVNMRHSLRRILDFLNLEEDEGRLRCAVSHPTGLFKRDHKKTTFDNPFTPAQTEIIRISINKLNNKLKEHRKETLPTHLYKQFDSIQTR